MKLPKEHIDKMYKVLVEGYKPSEVDSELYDEEDNEDVIKVIDPDYVNEITIENGEKVIYWEENYIAHYYRMGENDGEKEKEIIDALYEYNLWDGK